MAIYMVYILQHLIAEEYIPYENGEAVGDPWDGGSVGIDSGISTWLAIDVFCRINEEWAWWCINSMWIYYDRTIPIRLICPLKIT